MQDAVQVIIDVLKADAGVQALAGDAVNGYRIFGQELPIDKNDGMPKKTIIVRRISGVGGYVGQMPLERGVIDIVHYGATPAEAHNLRAATRDALRAVRPQLVDGTCLLYGLDPITAPIVGRDADTDWPFVTEPWSFLASE